MPDNEWWSSCTVILHWEDKMASNLYTTTWLHAHTYQPCTTQECVRLIPGLSHSQILIAGRWASYRQSKAVGGNNMRMRRGVCIESGEFIWLTTKLDLLGMVMTSISFLPSSECKGRQYDNNPSYSAFPSSCNIRLQERKLCHPIKLQNDLNSALWLAHTVDTLQPKVARTWKSAVVSEETNPFWEGLVLRQGESGTQTRGVWYPD